MADAASAPFATVVPEAKKKAAIASFFAKNKAKSKPAAGGDSVEQSGSGGGGGGGGAGSSASASSAGAGTGGAGTAGPWVEVTEERQQSGAHLTTRVGDLTDEDLLNAGASIDVEAEEAKKLFWASRKAVSKKKASHAATAEAPAVKPAVVGWRSKLAAGASGKLLASGKVDIKNSVLFPTLERAASGLHPAAVLVDMGSSDVSALGKASAWAAISLDDDDEEEETEEAERAVAPAAVAASTAARGATAGPASSVFSAPPSASSASASSSASAAGSGGVSAPRQQQQQQRSPVALTLAQLCPADPASSKAELDSPAAIKEAAAGIIQALRSTHDVSAAVASVSVSRAAPLSLRSGFVEALLQAGLDAETPADRLACGAALRGLLPARAVTPGMLTEVIMALLELYDDIAVDIPKAPEYFADLLDGLVVGSARARAGGDVDDAHLVPAGVLPPPVAAAMGIDAAATAAAASSTNAAAEPIAAAPASAAAPGVPLPAVIVASTAAAAAADGDAAAPAADAEADLDDVFAAAKKKKKKPAK